MLGSPNQALIERVVMLADTERRNGQGPCGQLSNQGPWSKATEYIRNIENRRQT